MKCLATLFLSAFCTLSLLAQQPAETFIHQGNLAVLNCQWDQAASFYTQEVKAHPTSAVGWFLTSMVELHVGKTDAAELDMKTAISIDPKSAALHMAMADIKSRRGLQKAIEELSEAIVLNPQYYDAYMLRAEMKMVMNQFQEALEDYEKAIAIKPELAKPYAEKAIILFKMSAASQNSIAGATMDDYSESEKAALDKTFTIIPKTADDFYYQGLFLFTTKRFSDSLTPFQKSIQIDPSNPRPYTYLARLNSFKDQSEQALINYDKSIEMDKKLSSLLMSHCEAELATDPEQAFDDYGKVFFVITQTGRCYSSRGTVKNSSQDPNWGISNLEESLRYNPDNELIHNLPKFMNVK